jgi:small-conductance mechanosensitive channel
MQANAKYRVMAAIVALMQGAAGLLLLVLVAMAVSFSDIGDLRAAEEEAATTTTDGLEAVIDYAKEQGVEVIIVSPGEEAAEPVAQETPLMSFSSMLTEFKRRGSDLFRQLGNVPESISEAVAAAKPSGDTSLLLLLALLVLVMVAAYAGERWFLHWLANRATHVLTGIETKEKGSAAAAVQQFLGRAFGVLLFGIGAVILTLIFLPSDDFTELTAVIVIGATALGRLVVEFWRACLAPQQPELRQVALDDDGASALFRWLVASAVIMFVLGVVMSWLEQIEVRYDAWALNALICTSLVLLFNLVLVASNRTRVANIIAGAGGGQLSRGGTFLVRNWHLIVAAYLVAAWIVTVIRLVMGWPDAVGLSGGMVAVLIVSLALYAAGSVMLHAYFVGRRARAHEARAAAQTANITADSVEEEAVEADSGADFERSGPYEDLARRCFIFAVATVAVGLTLYLWGANPLDENSPAVSFWEVLFVAGVGYGVYQLVRISADRKIAEQEELERQGLEGKGALSGLSRLSTLLPLFKSVILVAISIITVMIVLSELGVDIAPLFAGAGVIGLAIGFGAQTLVKDIISGAFFLADDAFRIGEYIDVGSAQGTVEKINIRSMQIRHYEGLLHTVPFGEIQLVTNWSRDWAMMKLKVRVPFDTDTERLNWLIKKLGKELLEDEYYGKMFLQQLKSQGVHSMDDSGMVVRLKFMTKPGDQYELRKFVYQKVQELFEREGIKFATRQVTVRLAEGENAGDLDEKTKKGIAGAVQPIIDEGGQ